MKGWPWHERAMHLAPVGTVGGRNYHHGLDVGIDRQEITEMERPRTGPMQFPGEIQPGVYLDRETVRMLFTADEAVALREIRQAFNGIQPVQQARLETEVIASVRAVEMVLASPDRGGAYQQALQAALDALKLAQEFKRA